MHSFHVERVVVVVAVEQHAFATTRSKMQNARDIRLSSEVIVSVKFIELFFHSFLLSSKHQNTAQQQKADATTSSAQTNKQSKQVGCFTLLPLILPLHFGASPQMAEQIFSLVMPWIWDWWWCCHC